MQTLRAARLSHAGKGLTCPRLCGRLHRSLTVKSLAAYPQLAELGERFRLQTSTKVLLTEPVPDLGRRLVAGEDVGPGEVLLNLPLDSAFIVSEARTCESPLPWSLELALQILEKRKEGETGAYGAWLNALPTAQELALPITTFRWGDVEACGLPDVVAEAGQMRAMISQAAEELGEELRQLHAGESDLAWAVGLVHSRSFSLSGPEGQMTHVVAPGIDMANHSFQPTALVRFRHSPEACQGQQAVEEVCEAPSGGGESTIQLVASESGISKGQELTISYGRHPDDVFFLFFGFLPESNPHNSVVLFRDLNDLALFMESEEGVPCSVASSLLPPEAASRLIVTGEGFDGRAVDAVLQLLAFKAKSEDGSKNEVDQRQLTQKAMRLLARRCQQLLGLLPSVAERCAAPGALTLSIALKARKRTLLEQLLQKFQDLGWM